MILYYALSIYPLIATAVASCPAECVCDEIAQCSTKNLFQVPTELKYVNVKLIDLRQNSIKNLTANSFSNGILSSVKTVYLGVNKITHIDENAFQGLIALENLNLQSNKIEILIKSTFAPLVRLSYLDLSNNPLTEIRGNSLSVPPLINIYLNNCKVTRLKHVFRPQSPNDSSWLNSVRHLHMDNNFISELSEEEISLIQNIWKVFMRGNSIKCNNITKPLLEAKSIACNFIESEYKTTEVKSADIVTVRADEGNTTEVNMKFMPGETTIFPENIRQRDIHGSDEEECAIMLFSHSGTNGTGATVCNYSHSELENISSCKIPANTTALLLNNNKIEVFTASIFYELTELVKLDLSWNMISNLPEKIFSNNQKLEWVSLARNPLSAISDMMFNNIPLIYLNLSYCPIEHFPSVDGAGRQIQTLDVSFTKFGEIPEHALQPLEYLKEVHISVFRGLCYDDVQRLMERRRGLSSCTCFECSAEACERKIISITRSFLMISRHMQICIITLECMFVALCIVFISVHHLRRRKRYLQIQHIYETIPESAFFSCMK